VSDNPIYDRLRTGAEDVPAGEAVPVAGAAARAEAWREVASWIRHQCIHQLGAPVCAECLQLTARIDTFADQIAKGAYAQVTT
jgi:hypothetical protein